MGARAWWRGPGSYGRFGRGRRRGLRGLRGLRRASGGAAASPDRSRRPAVPPSRRCGGDRGAVRTVVSAATVVDGGAAVDWSRTRSTWSTWTTGLPEVDAGRTTVGIIAARSASTAAARRPSTTRATAPTRSVGAVGARLVPEPSTSVRERRTVRRVNAIRDTPTVRPPSHRTDTGHAAVTVVRGLDRWGAARRGR